MKLTNAIVNKIETATLKDLVAFYNFHNADKQIKAFASKAKGVERVSALLEMLVDNYEQCPHCLDFADASTYGADATITAAGEEGTAAGNRMECHSCGTIYSRGGAVYTGGKGGAVAGRTNPTFAKTMSESLKLDRTVECIETGEVFKNCFRIFREGHMSNAQSDRLSHILYTAAKQGVRMEQEMNGKTYRLVNVDTNEGAEA